MTTIESGGHDLIIGRVRQQVTGELFDGKLIEGHIGVQRSDNPVSVKPHFAIVVQMQSVRVPIAHGIQPKPGHVLAITG